MTINTKPVSEVLGIPFMSYTELKTGPDRWKDFFGIELELEGARSDLGREFAAWVPHRDGSLRGGMEYVLLAPMGQRKLQKAIEEFYTSGVEGNDSLRASTHIHINGKDLTVGQLRSIIAIVYTLEPALFTWVDESRKWSGYCMGLDTMSQRRLRDLMSPDTLEPQFRQQVSPNGTERYYGLNIGSLRRHGSLEFRYFPGAPTKEQLETWLDLVEAIKKAGQTTPIDELLERVTNQNTLMAYLRGILPESVRDELLGLVDPEIFWNMFAQVTTMCEPAEGFVRRHQLVKVTRPLITYLVKNNKLSPLGADFLLKVGAQLKVMTPDDFRVYLAEAKQKNAEATPKTKARQADVVIDPRPLRPEPEIGLTAYLNMANAITEEREAAIRTYNRLRTRTLRNPRDQWTQQAWNPANFPNINTVNQDDGEF